MLMEKKQVDPGVRLATRLNKRRKKYKVLVNKETVATIQALSYEHALKMAQTDFPHTTIEVKNA